MQVRRVVGRHRERRDVVLAAADDADRDAERRAQQVVPLAHEIERRRDDQRAAPLVVDRQAGDVGLARAGRQHDDAAALRAPARPRAPRSGTGAARGARARPARARRSRARDPRRRRPPRAERAPHRRVGGRGRAEAGRARVPQAAGRRGRAGRQAADLDGAASKRERWQCAVRSIRRRAEAELERADRSAPPRLRRPAFRRSRRGRSCSDRRCRRCSAGG